MMVLRGARANDNAGLKYTSVVLCLSTRDADATTLSQLNSRLSPSVHHSIATSITRAQHGRPRDKPPSHPQKILALCRNQTRRLQHTKVADQTPTSPRISAVGYSRMRASRHYCANLHRTCPDGILGARTLDQEIVYTGTCGRVVCAETFAVAGVAG